MKRLLPVLLLSASTATSQSILPLKLSDNKRYFTTQQGKPWLACCKEGFGNTPEKPIEKNGVAKNRSYGQYLGKKFKQFNNLLWFAGETLIQRATGCIVLNCWLLQ